MDTVVAFFFSLGIAGAGDPGSMQTADGSPAMQAAPMQPAVRETSASALERRNQRIALTNQLSRTLRRVK